MHRNPPISIYYLSNASTDWMSNNNVSFSSLSKIQSYSKILDSYYLTTLPILILLKFKFSSTHVWHADNRHRNQLTILELTNHENSQRGVQRSRKHLQYQCTDSSASSFYSPSSGQVGNRFSTHLSNELSTRQIFELRRCPNTTGRRAYTSQAVSTKT